MDYLKVIIRVPEGGELGDGAKSVKGRGRDEVAVMEGLSHRNQRLGTGILSDTIAVFCGDRRYLRL